MQQREKLSWPLLFIIILILALLFMLSPIEIPISPFAGNIIGSMFGFLLAMTFAEIVKLDEKRERAKNTESEILDEIFAIGKSIEKHSDIMPIDIWELAIATGNLSLIDLNQRKKFTNFYKLVRTYNRIQEMKQNVIAAVAKEDGDTSKLLGDAEKKSIMAIRILANSLKKG